MTTTSCSGSGAGSRRGSGGGVTGGGNGGGTRTPGRGGSADASQRDSPSQLGATNCLRWAECLQNLLDDPEGVLLLKQFMEDMNPSHARAFDFYFAVKGLKSGCQPGWENPRKLVRLINKTYIIREGCVPISAAARLAIQARVRSGDSDPRVFDPALEEVVQFLTHTVYPAFLKSDLYVNYLACVGGAQQPLCPAIVDAATSASPAAVHTPRSLPTLHEDKELPQQQQQQMAATATTAARAGSVPRSRPTSGGPAAPAASAGAATSAAAAAAAGAVLDLTSYNLYATRFQRGRSSLPEFAGSVGQTGAVCYSMSQAALPYHTSYAPGSKQDSELQSLSSDALTDDTHSQADTVSSFEAAAAVAAAATAAASASTAAGRRGLRRAVRRSADLNKEDPRAAIIPRPAGQPTGCDPAKDPGEFARLLTEKLLAHQHDLDSSERLAEAISRPDRSDTPAAAAATAAAASGAGAGVLSSPWAQRILARTRSSDNPEQILDNHLETVFDRAQQPPPQQPQPPPSDTEHVHHYHYHHHYASQSKSATSLADSGVGTVSSRGRSRFSASAPVDHHQQPQPPALSAQPLASQQQLPQLQPPLPFAAPGPPATATTQRQLNLHVAQHAGPGSGFAGPRQPFACDPNMPLVDMPLTDNVIVEARRRLEEMSVVSAGDAASSAASTFGAVGGGAGASGSGASSQQQQPLTIGYFLFGESVPYRHTWSGREITLGQFKQLIAKKGSFRYFFKKRSDEFVVGGAVQEEVTDDAEVLPLWEGKVVGKVEKFE